VVFLEKFLAFTSRLVGYIAIGLSLGLGMFLANKEIRDLDLWLHIATGRYIVQHGYVPLYDIFSATIPGQTWDNHEWLFQIMVARIYDVFGPSGLHTMQSVVVVFTLGLLLIVGLRLKWQVVSVIGLPLVLMVYQHRFTMRPDLFSITFLVLFLILLSFYSRRQWVPWAFFFMQIVWVNTHGFFILGPFIVLIWIDKAGKDDKN
jgi:hypothetical protein